MTSAKRKWSIPLLAVVAVGCASSSGRPGEINFPATLLLDFSDLHVMRDVTDPMQPVIMYWVGDTQNQAPPPFQHSFEIPMRFSVDVTQAWKTPEEKATSLAPGLWRIQLIAKIGREPLPPCSCDFTLSAGRTTRATFKLDAAGAFGGCIIETVADQPGERR